MPGSRKDHPSRYRRSNDRMSSATSSLNATGAKPADRMRPTTPPSHDARRTPTPGRTRGPRWHARQPSPEQASRCLSLGSSLPASPCTPRRTGGLRRTPS
uniref:GRAS7 n=1 Tax=Arundo donax TaxID=35708 RepID=A0A0A9D8Z3_ARUDO